MLKDLKTKFTYFELRRELLNCTTRLIPEEIVLALDIMEKNNHEIAEFGIGGSFMYSMGIEEIKQ